MGAKPLSKKAILDITRGAAADDEMAELARQIKPLVDALATLSPSSAPEAKRQKRSVVAPVAKGERKRK
jgi:hypothetical protein